jgi:hypothetical protein
MDTNLLDKEFARIGARLKVADRLSRPNRTAGAVSLDVRTDRKGEFFEIVRQPGTEAEIAVLDVQPADRHLLLLVRDGKQKSKLLCGHDERHWFVAGIPERAPVGTVRQAKEALKPVEVQTAQARHRLKAGARSRRKNAAYICQGEWFFLPVGDVAVDEKLVLRDEPLTRGNGGKPHWAEFCYRTGGETVHVCSRHPNGVTEAQYQKIVAGNPQGEGLGLAHDAAQPRCLRQGAHPAPRPRHDHLARVAPGRDEHRRPVQGDEKRGLPGLTATAKHPKQPVAVRSRCGLLAFGEDIPNRRERWIAAWSRSASSWQSTCAMPRTPSA